MYIEVFEYNIKFDYDNASDRKFKKFIAADSVEEAKRGIDEIIAKLIRNGEVGAQNLREIIAEPKADGDYEKTTFGKFTHDANSIKEKFKEFFLG